MQIFVLWLFTSTKSWNVAEQGFKDVGELNLLSPNHLELVIIQPNGTVVNWVTFFGDFSFFNAERPFTSMSPNTTLLSFPFSCPLIVFIKLVNANKKCLIRLHYYESTLKKCGWRE